MKSGLISILLLTCFLSQAQVNFGLKAGTHSYDISIVDDAELSQKVANANFGVHLGAEVKIKLSSLILMPSIMLNNVSTKYKVDDPAISEIESSLTHLEIPVMLGIDLFMLNLHAGPVAHFRMNGLGEIKELASLEKKWSPAVYGAQLGARLNIKKLFVEIRYEKNFYSKDPIINASRLMLIDSYARVLASAGLFF